MGVPDLKVTQSGVRVKKRGKVQFLLPVKVQLSASVIGHGVRKREREEQRGPSFFLLSVARIRQTALGSLIPSTGAIFTEEETQSLFLSLSLLCFT